MTRPNRSFWEKELYDQKYDLIVIGAGLTGLSAAYFFREKHPKATVLVVDRGFFPIGASTRNAGFACIGSVGELISDLEIETEEIVKQRIKDRYNGLLLLRKILGDQHIDYKACGGWEIFTDLDEFIRLQESVPKLNALMEEMIGEKNVFEISSYSGNASFFNRVEGQLHPGKMIKTLYQKCIQSGIEFRWDTNIQKIDTDLTQITCHRGYQFRSDKLIIATNAFTSELLPKQKISPGRGYAFITNKLTLMNWKGTFHFNKGYVYFRNIGEDRLLLGGGRNIAYEEECTSEFGVNQTIKEYLINFADEVLRLEKGWTIEHEWSGIMGFTKSKSYLLENISPNCVLAAGLSGMGVALGMNLGKKASKLV